MVQPEYGDSPHALSVLRAEYADLLLKETSARHAMQLGYLLTVDEDGDRELLQGLVSTWTAATKATSDVQSAINVLLDAEEHTPWGSDE